MKKWRGCYVMTCGESEREHAVRRVGFWSLWIARNKLAPADWCGNDGVNELWPISTVNAATTGCSKARAQSPADFCGDRHRGRIDHRGRDLCAEFEAPQA